MRPCTCEVCSSAADPAMFTITDLEDFARAGDPIQCRASHKLLDPIPLLKELSSDPTLWRTAKGTIDRASESVIPAPLVPEAFVSYKWGGEAESLVEETQDKLTARGVIVIRDKNEMEYRDSIRNFMRRIGAGKLIVMVIDKAYLESENCMFD